MTLPPENQRDAVAFAVVMCGVGFVGGWLASLPAMGGLPW